MLSRVKLRAQAREWQPLALGTICSGTTLRGCQRGGCAHELTAKRARARSTPVRLFYGHEPGAGGAPRYVALQRAAAAGGLAHLDGSHLCLHHKFGPWFTLRATLVFDAVEYTGAGLPAAVQV